MQNINKLEKHTGLCCIVASGASIGYIDKRFFDGKFVIGLNQMAKQIKCDIVVAKEKPTRFGEEIIVVSKKQYGGGANADNTEGDYFFEHNSNKHQTINFPSDSDWLVVSWSTITSALHLACYLGFTEICLCGHDCGTLDGMITTENYYSGLSDPRQLAYHNWLKSIEPQTVTVRDWLVEKYGVIIYSINPFVSLNLEGHKFN